MKDIIHQASNKLAVVCVIREPHIVFSGVHARLKVGFAQAPTGGTVVLMKKHKADQHGITLSASAVLIRTSYKLLH